MTGNDCNCMIGSVRNKHDMMHPFLLVFVSVNFSLSFMVLVRVFPRYLWTGYSNVGRAVLAP